MSQIPNAHLLPQELSFWHRLLMNRKLTIGFFFLLEVLFLLSSYVFLRHHFPSLIFWEHILSFLTLFYLLNRQMDSRSKVSWLVIIAIFPIFGSSLLYFSLADWGVRRLKHRLEAVTDQVSENVMTSQETQAQLATAAPDFRRLTTFLQQSPAHFPTYANTQITYFPLGDDMFPKLLEDLRAAQRYIFMEYFIIDEGKMWGDILAVLEEKAQAGLDVRVMFDGMNEMTTLSYDYLTRLERVGIKAQAFSPLKPILSTYYNYRDHRKITVIDGQVAYTGGVNIADEYINQKERFGHWKDTAIRLDGEAVQTFKALFLTMWAVTGDELTPELAAYLDERPQGRPSQGLVIPYANSPLTYHKVAEDVYLDMLYTATDYVHIMTPYLILDDELQRAMTYAAKRGVDVRLILPGIPDKQYAFDIATSYFKSLISAGVTIYRYTPGFVHAKVYVSDDRRAVVGTINTDYRSLYQNFEDAVYLYQVPEIDKIAQDFQDTLAQSDQLILADLERQSWTQRMGAYVYTIIGPLM